jgi:hypothetical protein
MKQKVKMNKIYNLFSVGTQYNTHDSIHKAFSVYFQQLGVEISTLSSIRPSGEQAKNQKKKDLQNKKDTLRNEKKELKTLEKLLKQY